MATETRHVAVLLDESGSMGGLAPTVRSETNKYLEDIRPNRNARITIANFDQRPGKANIRYVCENTKPRDVPHISEANYSPLGSTPLLDAVGVLVRRMDKLVGKDGIALVVIYTDGYENASRTETTETVSKLVRNRIKRGWDFVFLGAGIDAWDQAAKLGIDLPGSVFNTVPTASGYAASNAMVTNSTQSYLAGASSASLRATRNAVYGDTIPDPNASGASQPPVQPPVTTPKPRTKRKGA